MAGLNTEWSFNFLSQGRGALDPKIKRKRSGMYYVGSWKYKKVKIGLSRPGRFDLVPTSSVSEKELLKRMSPYTKHNKLKSMIEKRLRRLHLGLIGSFVESREPVSILTG